METCSWACDYVLRGICSPVVTMQPFPHIEMRKPVSDDVWNFCESPEIKIAAVNNDEGVL